MIHFAGIYRHFCWIIWSFRGRRSLGRRHKRNANYL